MFTETNPSMKRGNDVKYNSTKEYVLCTLTSCWLKYTDHQYTAVILKRYLHTFFKFRDYKNISLLMFSTLNCYVKTNSIIKAWGAGLTSEIFLT